MKSEDPSCRPLARPRSASALLFLAVSLAACSAGGGRAGLEDCRRPDFAGKALCRTLSLPEDPGDPLGRAIPLNIVVLPAVDGGRRPDAVLYLVGGPGLGATESAATFALDLSALRETHDIVLVDQRGTGRSNPLHCPMSPTETLGAILAGRYAPEVIESCLDALDADPVFYTSADIIDDLDAVRSFLGYEQFNLVGVSYGSRLALGYLERFPDRVRTVALRGVASPAGDLLSDIGLASEQAIARLFARCSADPECSSEFPDLEPAARRILARFEDEPLDLRTAGPGGESVHVTVTRDLFAGLLRYALYSDTSAPVVPKLILDASRDSWSLLSKALAGYLGPGLAESLAFGSYLSIVCAEDMPFFDRTGETRAGDPFFFTDSIIDNHERACSLWPHRQAPASSKQPVRSSVPALLMSGSDDPATSAEAADEIERFLEDSRHLVTPGLAHFPVWTDCFADNVAKLVRSGSTGAIDAGCVEDYVAVSPG